MTGGDPWARCSCGLIGWRYAFSDGTSGWSCWCGRSRPDQLERADVEVQLPLFETEAA